jgi:hypothetical protein
MKSVLMAVYSFSAPPCSEAGGLSAVIGQLRNYGWEPVVLTRGTGTEPQEKRLLQLPEDIDIIRTGPFGDGFTKAEALPGFFRFLLERNGQKLWEFLSRSKASRLVKNGGADLIYTVSPFYSSHRIGLHLKKKNPNLPWVADLGPSGPALRSCERELLARIRETADILVPDNPEINAQELSELFEKACRSVAAKKLGNP